MDTMPSTQFRKTYSALTEPVQVTVNGHVIGEWTPVRHPRWMTVQEMKAAVAGLEADARVVADEVAERFNTRPFTPAPKPGKKGK